MNGWMNRCLTCYLVGWLVGWLGWLVGWLAGWIEVKVRHLFTYMYRYCWEEVCVVLTIHPVKREKVRCGSALTRRLSSTLADWLWLIDWLADWLTGWLIDRFAEWLVLQIDWLADYLVGWSTGLLTDWFADWLIGRLTIWHCILSYCRKRLCSATLNRVRGRVHLMSRRNFGDWLTTCLHMVSTRWVAFYCDMMYDIVRPGTDWRDDIINSRVLIGVCNEC